MTSHKFPAMSRNKGVYVGSQECKPENTLLLAIKTGNLSRYIRVKRQDDGPTMNLVEDLLRRREDNATKAVAIVSKETREPNIPLQLLRFDQHLVDFDAKELMWLYGDALARLDVSTTVDMIAKALLEIVRKAQALLARGSVQLSLQLNMRDKGKEEAMLASLDKRSVKKYVGTWKKIMTYVLRLWARDARCPAARRSRLPAT